MAPDSSRSPTVSVANGKTLLVAATGWGPSSGGGNAFSLDFCLALGRLLRGSARVICLTAPVDQPAIASAAEQGVQVLTLPGLGPDDPAGTAQGAADLLRRSGVDRLDLAIGHDVLTGPVVTALRSMLGGTAAVIHHMSYGSYQAYKADGPTARQKEYEQRRILRAADVVLAIGPLLRDSAEDLCQGTRDVSMLVPGLADIEPAARRPLRLFRAIAFGRLGGADDRIKQGTLAAAGYGRFVRRAHEFGLRHRHRFNVFGLSAPEFASEEETLKAVVNGEAGRVVNVVACPYTEDREELFEELARNEVALMLSWHEGFGLVGWEAIAAEVPLIVSEATGLYALLRDGPATLGAGCVSAVDVRGSSGGTPDERDVDAVASALFRVAADLPGALAQARKLRQHLRELYTWEGCAAAALEACGWADLLPARTVRGSPADQADLRAGVRPAGGRGYRDDIETLLALTREMTAQHARFASIRVHGCAVKIRRRCVAALVAAAAGGSVLVVGEPGAGKSGAQYDAVGELVASGADVVVLAAEALAAESLGELRNELGLEHELIDVLANWPGASPGYLVVDALDAARSDGVARALRELIGRVIGRGGRWKVVASVRKFDLRHSPELQRFVPGTPAEGFEDPDFPGVRHLCVPLLDDAELGQATDQSADLEVVVDGAGDRLRRLLRVPFNLSLVAAILEEGVSAAELTPVRTQLELLDRYWDARVRRCDRNGDARDAVLRLAAEEMVRRRALRAPRNVIARDPSASEPLHEVLSANVLVEWRSSEGSRPNQSLLAFSHHLLFDYGVARLILRGEPGDVLRLLEAEPDLSLWARPSIVLHFQHLWSEDPDRGLFWELADRLLRSGRIPEIAKTIAPGVAAELFAVPEDLSPVLTQLGGGDGL